MLLKAHLTSHSRISISRLVITLLWLSGSWRSLYSSSVHSCHLFLISSASVRFIPFLSFIEPIFAWNIPLVSLIFLKRSLVFPILLFSSISLNWSLRKAFLSLSLLFFGTLHSDGYIFPFLICLLLLFYSGFPVAQRVKHLPTMWETWVWSLGREDPLEKEMATQSSTLAWKIPWTEKAGRVQSMGLQRVGHDWVTSLWLFSSIHSYL